MRRVPGPERTVVPRIAAVAAFLALTATARAQEPAPPGGSEPSTAAPTAAAVTPAPPRRESALDPVGFLAADSELVYGPTLYGFDVAAFASKWNGYLTVHVETVDGEAMYGYDVVQRVAEDYSVGPRVLLALVEAHSGWVTQPEPSERTFAVDQPVPGLYDALGLTADQLNAAYYGHKHDEQRKVALADGSAIAVGDTNAGTFAVLAQTSKRATMDTWSALEGASRFSAAWTRLFGDPYRYQVQPTLPPDIPYVETDLPFPTGTVWFYTAGPHAPRGIGAANAAVGFSPPPAGETGCHPSAVAATAVAAGSVLRSRASGVVVDLDGDGYAGSGWAHVYVHTHPFMRAEVGATLEKGAVVGYPSCEGGLPTQTRISVARTYNGEWVPADYGPAPMILGGWNVVAGDRPGEGWLFRSGVPPRRAGPEKDAAVNGVAALPQG